MMPKSVVAMHNVGIKKSFWVSILCGTVLNKMTVDKIC